MRSRSATTTVVGTGVFTGFCNRDGDLLFIICSDGPKSQRRTGLPKERGARFAGWPHMPIEFLHGRPLSPEELEIIRRQIEEGFEVISAVDPEIHGIVARNWPHLVAKLPPREQADDTPGKKPPAPSVKVKPERGKPQRRDDNEPPARPRRVGKR